MQQVTIMTESQKRAERERRKQARRAGRVAASAEANGSGQTTEEELLTAMGVDVDAVRRDREAELQRNASRTGVRAVSAGAGGGAGLEVKRSLPSNTVRIEHSNYEEVYIPAVKRAPFGQNERLIPVDEFPKWAQVRRCRRQSCRHRFRSLVAMLCHAVLCLCCALPCCALPMLCFAHALSTTPPPPLPPALFAPLPFPILFTSW